MFNLEIKTGGLRIWEPGQSRSTCNLFVSKPTPLEERSLGRLFILTEIFTANNANQQIISAIHEEIKNNFYGAKETNPEAAFEAALQKTNRKIQQIISEGSSNHWVEKLSIIVTLVKENNVYLSQAGLIYAFLVHQSKIIDILGQTGHKTEEINPLKIFSSTLSGHLQEDDAIILCTASLLDYLSQEKLKDILINHSPHHAAKHLEELLGATNATTAFGGIIIKLLSQKERVKEERSEKIIPSQTSPSYSSMEELLGKEKATSELLTGSIWPQMTKNLKLFNHKIKEFIKNKSGKRGLPLHKEGEPLTGVPYSPQEKLGQPFSLKATFKKGGAKTIYGIKSLVSLLRRERVRKIKDLPETTTRGILGGIVSFKKLPKARKRLLIGALILIFIFAESVVLLGKRQERIAQEKRYEEIILAVKDKQLAIEDALIYDNKEEARELLTESYTALDQIPSESKKYKDRVSTLSQELQEKSAQINDITYLDNPKVLADFSALAQGINTPGFIKINNVLYSFNQENNSIFKLDLEEEKAEILVDKPEDMGGNFLFGITPDDKNILFYHSQGGLTLFNPQDKSLAPASIAFLNPEHQEIKAMAPYASRLYLLDTKNNQIVKHNKVGDNYGQGAAWLQNEEVNLQDGQSLFIDGNIYVTKADGQILKLFAGDLDTEFKPEEFEPQLESPLKITTVPNSEKLYIIDPPTKRLVILTKTGKLVGQYISEQFNQLSDLVVNDREDTVYLLSGTKVFAVEIAQ